VKRLKLGDVRSGKCRRTLRKQFAPDLIGYVGRGKKKSQDAQMKACRGLKGELLVEFSYLLINKTRGKRCSHLSVRSMAGKEWEIWKE